MVCECYNLLAVLALPRHVLILVLMEYGLRGRDPGLCHQAIPVLILVLMEYGLRVEIIMAYMKYWVCLNPCFNGIWSARVKSVKICM